MPPFFGGYTANSSSLSAFIEDYFEVPVSVQQFVGNWLSIPSEERARPGTAVHATTLGRNCVIGDRVWNAHLKFRIHLGPIGHEDYLRFLPNHDSFYKLQDAVRQYAGDHLDCELKVTLKAAEVPCAQLGKRSFFRLEQLDGQTGQPCRCR